MKTKIFKAQSLCLALGVEYKAAWLDIEIPLFIFNDPKTGSTLGCFFHDMSLKKMAEIINNSRIDWGILCSKIKK